MRKFIAFTFIISSFSLLAQKPINVTLSGNFFNIKADTIYIAKASQNGLENILKAVVNKKGDFKIAGKLPAADYYVLRVDNQTLNLILRDKSDIKIYGDGKDIASFNNVIGSDETMNLNAFVTEMRSFNTKKDSANAYLQQHPDQYETVNQSFNRTYQEFNNYKRKFVVDNPNSPALIAVLQTLDVNQEFPAFESIILQLEKGFPESPTVVSFKKDYEQLKAKNQEKDFLSPGKIAPDFTQAKIDGTPMKLSDLKGKVVLIDFWASWCGPCRKENPNVVNLYKKYEKDGFTVMSVSLDKSKDAWVAAIEKDNLIWPNHVSDLKQWSNEVAQQYKVTGIPFTVLIDQEGKIINTNLRGADLDNTLKSIFGH